MYYGYVFLPAGYVSGAALSSTSTWTGQTLATLGVTVGTYTWTFGSGASADSVVVYAGTAPPSAAVAVTPPPIPDNVAPHAVPGIDPPQPKVLDLSSGSGPSMTTCLLGTVKQMFGADATYVGQSANGAAQVAVGGQTISFYPLAASTSTAIGIGAFLTGDNSENLGTSCGTFNVVPAVASLNDLGVALAAIGLSAQVDAQGVITVAVNGNLYVVRPDYFVTQGTSSDTPGLAFGSDGLLRFTDSAGKVQILRAAFLNPMGLQSAMGNALGGTLTIQADGSGVFTRINGSQFALTPEMVLSPAPDGLHSAKWVNDSANHYLYLIAVYYQGLTASAR